MSHLLMFAKIADLSIKTSDLTHESGNFTESDLFKHGVCPVLQSAAIH